MTQIVELEWKSKDENNNSNAVEISHWYTIDRNMLPAKIVSFFDYGRIGSISQYFVLFFVSIGLNTAQAGFICGIQLIGGMVGGPFWGYVADRTLCHGIIVNVMCIISTLTFFLIPGLVVLFGDPDKSTCRTVRTNTTFGNVTSGQIHHNGNTMLFYTILGVSILGSFFHEAIEVIATTGIVQAVRRSSSKDNFGRQMFLAPAGFAIMGFLSGILIHHFPQGPVTCYTGMFVVYAIAIIGLMTGFHFLFKGHHMTRANKIQKENVNKTLMETMKKFETWLFFSIVLFNGIATTIFFEFSFLFLSQRNATHSLLGLSMLSNGISAGIFYACSQRITKLLGGPIIAMALSYFVWIVRSLCLAHLNNPQWILAINLMNGLTNSIFVCSYMEYIKNKFPPNIYTSVCGIAVMLYNGGGGIIAYVAGGKIYLEFGGKNLFIASSVMCTFWTIVTLVYACMDKLNNRQTVPKLTCDKYEVNST